MRIPPGALFWCNMDKCNQEVYDNGTVMFVSDTIRSVRVEEWVQAIAKESGQLVDWHQFAGRVVVKALGDLHKVRKAIVKLRHMHDEGYTEAILELGCFNEQYAKERSQKIWDRNCQEYDLWSYTCSKCRGRCMPQNHAGWDPTQEGHG